MPLFQTCVVLHPLSISEAISLEHRISKMPRRYKLQTSLSEFAQPYYITEVIEHSSLPKHSSPYIIEARPKRAWEKDEKLPARVRHAEPPWYSRHEQDPRRVREFPARHRDITFSQRIRAQNAEIDSRLPRRAKVDGSLPAGKRVRFLLPDEVERPKARCGWCGQALMG